MGIVAANARMDLGVVIAQPDIVRTAQQRLCQAHGSRAARVTGVNGQGKVRATLPAHPMTRRGSALEACLLRSLSRSRRSAQEARAVFGHELASAQARQQ